MNSDVDKVVLLETLLPPELVPPEDSLILLNYNPLMNMCVYLDPCNVINDFSTTLRLFRDPLTLKLCQGTFPFIATHDRVPVRWQPKHTVNVEVRLN